MSTPKKDWIFTAVLVLLIAVLTAVVAIRLLASRSQPGAVAMARRAAPVGAEATALPSPGEAAPSGSSETPYSPPAMPAASPAGAETAYSPVAQATTPGAATKAPAARTPRVATARSETNYSPPGRATRPAVAGKAASAAAGTSGTGTLASAQEKDLFPYLGLVNPFDPIATPTPTPPPPAPPTPRPNDLNRALQNWVMAYPLNRGLQWVFTDKVKKTEFTVEIGKPYHLRDVSDFDAQVTADGKWIVQFEFQGQVKKFNYLE